MNHIIFAQVVWTVQQWQLFAPIIVLGGLVGWRRGWREMAIFVVAVVFAIFVANGLRPNIPPILERLTNVGKQFGNALTDPSNSPVPRPVSPEPPGWLQDPTNEPLIMLGFFLFLVLAGYSISKALGTRGNLGLFGLLGGVIFGASAFTIVLWQLLSYWLDLNRLKSGNLPFKGVASTPPVSVNLPGVQVPGLPTTNILDSWVFWAVGAAVLGILVIALRRSPTAAK